MILEMIVYVQDRCDKCKAYLKELDKLNVKYSVVDADKLEGFKICREKKIDLFPRIVVYEINPNSGKRFCSLDQYGNDGIFNVTNLVTNHLERVSELKDPIETIVFVGEDEIKNNEMFSILEGHGLSFNVDRHGSRLKKRFSLDEFPVCLMFKNNSDDVLYRLEYGEDLPQEVLEMMRDKSII